MMRAYSCFLVLLICVSWTRAQEQEYNDVYALLFANDVRNAPRRVIAPDDTQVAQDVDLPRAVSYSVDNYSELRENKEFGQIGGYFDRLCHKMSAKNMQIPNTRTAVGKRGFWNKRELVNKDEVRDAEKRGVGYYRNPGIVDSLISFLRKVPTQDLIIMQPRGMPAVRPKKRGFWN